MIKILYIGFALGSALCTAVPPPRIARPTDLNPIDHSFSTLVLAYGAFGSADGCGHGHAAKVPLHFLGKSYAAYNYANQQKSAHPMRPAVGLGQWVAQALTWYSWEITMDGPPTGAGQGYDQPGGSPARTYKDVQTFYSTLLSGNYRYLPIIEDLYAWTNGVFNYPWVEYAYLHPLLPASSAPSLPDSYGSTFYAKWWLDSPRGLGSGSPGEVFVKDGNGVTPGPPDIDSAYEDIYVGSYAE